MILNFDINKKKLKNEQILQLWLCGAIIQLIKTAADYAVSCPATLYFIPNNVKQN